MLTSDASLQERTMIQNIRKKLASPVFFSRTWQVRQLDSVITGTEKAPGDLHHNSRKSSIFGLHIKHSPPLLQIICHILSAAGRLITYHGPPIWLPHAGSGTVPFDLGTSFKSHRRTYVFVGRIALSDSSCDKPARRPLTYLHPSPHMINSSTSIYVWEGDKFQVELHNSCRAVLCQAYKVTDHWPRGPLSSTAEPI